MSWTDDRVERLKKLWNDGLSASQIAAELAGGVTRNAVIGKVHRLGLSGRAKSPNRTAARPKRTAAASGFNARPGRTAGRVQANGKKISALVPATAAGPQIRQELPAPDPLKLELTQLTEVTCKWPIGDPAQEDFFFCGHRCKEGSPYCDFHASIAYQPLADRRRDRRADAASA